MRNTGMSRAIDPLGRIVLPKEIRDSLNLTTGVRLDIGVSNDKIILSRNEAFCACCGGTNDHMLYHAGVAVCPECIRKFVEVGDDDY